MYLIDLSFQLDVIWYFICLGFILCSKKVFTLSHVERFLVSSERSTSFKVLVYIWRTNLRVRFEHFSIENKFFQTFNAFIKQDNRGFIHKIVRICITWLKNFADNLNHSTFSKESQNMVDGWYEQESGLRFA